MENLENFSHNTDANYNKNIGNNNNNISSNNGLIYDISGNSNYNFKINSFSYN